MCIMQENDHGRRRRRPKFLRPLQMPVQKLSGIHPALSGKKAAISCVARRERAPAGSCGGQAGSARGRARCSFAGAARAAAGCAGREASNWLLLSSGLGVVCVHTGCAVGGCSLRARQSVSRRRRGGGRAARALNAAPPRARGARGGAARWALRHEIIN